MLNHLIFFIFLRLDELITLAATMADAEVLFSLNMPLVKTVFSRLNLVLQRRNLP